MEKKAQWGHRAHLRACPHWAFFLNKLIVLSIISTRNANLWPSLLQRIVNLLLQILLKIYPNLVLNFWQMVLYPSSKSGTKIWLVTGYAWTLYPLVSLSKAYIDVEQVFDKGDFLRKSVLLSSNRLKKVTNFGMFHYPKYLHPKLYFLRRKIN